MLSETEDKSPEFEASPQAEEAGVDLESARRAYEVALNKLHEEFPDIAKTKHLQTIEMGRRGFVESVVRFPFVLAWTILGIPVGLFVELKEILVETAADVRGLFNGKDARLQEVQKSERSRHLQRLLLETLWARDYVQYILSQPEPVAYHVKRDTLQFLISHDDLLDGLRRRAVEEADLNPIQLRKAQPTPPPDDAWWWYMDNRRIRRARRMNAFWFSMAVIPALAAIILITLLTQRLAIDGPDVLSGASALAQLVLGAGSVLAGRELLNMFLFDRSSGRSWQGEATFALATLFLGVVAAFYAFAPPAAAAVYNWFGQRAIESGHAAEAELYLESAARLDPDPHAANLLEVGCLYQTFCSRDRAQQVFERVLEADSRLLLARYHLAELYSSQGEYSKARQLASDGLNLLSSGRSKLASNNAEDLLPGINDTVTANKIDYLLRLTLGRAHLGAGEAQSAKQALAEAAQRFNQLSALGIFNIELSGAVELPCTFANRPLNAYIATTKLDLLYLQARTFDAICQSEADNQAAVAAWTQVARSNPIDARQEGYRAEAISRIQVNSCTELST
jgi:tetratricopeptide (TPR) repeat protein